MKGKQLRLFGCFVLFVLALIAVVELSTARLGVGVGEWVVHVEGESPAPITSARFAMLFGNQETANAFEALKRNSEGVLDERGRVSDTRRAFTISGLTTSQTSPFGIIANEFSYLPRAMLHIVLADRSEWATVVDLPDPRKSRNVTFHLTPITRLR
jgi:hypothetical protein